MTADAWPSAAPARSAYSRGKDTRRRLYRKLIAATHATRAALLRAAQRPIGLTDIAAERWRAQVRHYLPLITRVLTQSERRVLRGRGGHDQKPLGVRKLRNFRAGIEAGISCFKRAYGGGRCTWRGIDHFKAYVWSAVVAHNLVRFARLKPA